MTAPLKPTHCPDQKGGKSARKRNSDENVLQLLREVELNWLSSPIPMGHFLIEFLALDVAFRAPDAVGCGRTL